MIDCRTLLVTDVVGSTALASRLGDDAIASLWREHDRRARDLLQQWSGREIDKSDGFLLLFVNAADAAGFATAYHHLLTTLSVPVQARVGIHVAAVRLRENPSDDVARGAKPLEVEGLGKAVAARAMSIARGRQTLITAAAFEHLGHGPWRHRSHGHWLFKGLDGPIELIEIGDEDAAWSSPVDNDKAYRVIWADGRWAPMREIAHSLPAERDSFIGRRAELRQLASLWGAGARLVTVIGPGGSGKTRLLLQHGRDTLGEYAGGVWFCDLSPAREAAELVQATAQGLRLDLRSGEPLSLVSAAIAGRERCLVLLDNFEQVASHAEGTLGHWLERAPQARFIVSSRERLRIAGEHVLMLEPMPTPDAGELFVRRAAASRGIDGGPATADSAVSRLVELLDGLPLAIELAAARTTVMSPAELLARMGQHLSLLEAGGARRDRRATLRATFDWSWELLSTSERQALAQMSVFEGGASLAAIQSVLDPGPGHSAVDLLHSLVEKSLVQKVGPGRYALLRTVRDYAAEQLAGLQIEVFARRRHASHFASLSPREAVADRCIDLENMAAAVRHAVDLGETELAVAALQGAWSAITLRGPFALALELAHIVAPHVAARPGWAARCALVAGWAHKSLGRSEQGREQYLAAVAGAAAAGEFAIECRAQALLGQLEAASGQVAQSERALARAAQLAHSLGDAALHCEVESSLGGLWLRQGRHETAAEHYLRALDFARQRGDRRWEGGTLGNLGIVRDGQGRRDEARRHYEAALMIARDLGDRQWEGNTLSNLGLMLQFQGRLSEARDALEQSLSVAREIGHGGLESVALSNLALVAESQHAPLDALRLHDAALNLAREMGDRRTQGEVLMLMGLVQARIGQHEAADQSLVSAEVLLEEMSDRAALGLLRCAQAEAHHLAGRTQAAQQALAAAQACTRHADGGAESELGSRLAVVARIVAGGVA